ncbi:MAG: septation protein A [Gammaproteobacteria bacterium]|nr:septation protein A [Gammaproteobacteria bacterium]MDH5652132.1 septation protein A [Gammaproteobacteria bacterium]
MKFLFDFFPLILFFIVYKSYDDNLLGVIAGTKMLIAAGIIQNGIFWLKNRRFETMHLITLVLGTVLGGATIYFHNADFIKWKPTAVYWLFALVFMGSEFIGKKSVIRRMLEKNITLPDEIWSRLSYAWTAFFTALGSLNLYIAFTFSLDTWVLFKVYGIIGLILLFVIAQAVYMARFISEDASVEQSNPEE